jgi:hypothetical protein
VTTLLKRDAEAIFIREWNALPELQRQTEYQAAAFAIEMKNKYPFQCEGDRALAILQMILEFQGRKGVPLASSEVGEAQRVKVPRLSRPFTAARQKRASAS